MNYSITQLFAKLIYSQFWNIGFTPDKPETVIQNKGVSKINWMKHPYKDRWFADPFVVKEDDKEIVVFVEELMISTPKGYLVELHVDKATYRLLSRFVLLELETHLSFPAFFYYNGDLYVYPENGASGFLNLYKYEESSHSLVFLKEIMSEALADAIIVHHGGSFLMFATRSESAQDGALLFESSQVDGPYSLKIDNYFDKGCSCSRSAGSLFEVNAYYTDQSKIVRYAMVGGLI